MKQAAFLVFLIVLRQVERGLCDREHCTMNQRCFYVVHDAVDFTNAEYCKRHIMPLHGYRGYLMAIKSQEDHDIVLDLLNGSSGDYWMGLRLPDERRCPDRESQLLGYEWETGGNDTHFVNWDKIDRHGDCSARCVSVSAERNSTWRQRPCDVKLQGYLCAYSFGIGLGCDALSEENAENRVRYFTPLGSAAPAGLERFPPGSVAIQKPLDVKRLCFLGHWIRAPWACGLLWGGCEHGCESENQVHRCTCPTGLSLRPNNVTCGCSGAGYVLAADGKSCVVDACAGCAGENAECINNACVCRHGFGAAGDDGECVNNEICYSCEHGCAYEKGAFSCACRSGYKVMSEQEPTRCRPDCTGQTCEAYDCTSIPEQTGEYCTCPDGYMQDTHGDARNVCEDIDECFEKTTCDHVCKNTFGSYVCSCREGYELRGDKCVSTDDSEGSGAIGPHQPSISTVPVPRPSLIPPAVGLLPPYVKAGSILAILLSVAFLMALLYLLVRSALKRSGKFYVDVSFAVTTEKYKQFSFDNQWKNDSQRL